MRGRKEFLIGNPCWGRKNGLSKFSNIERKIHNK